VILLQATHSISDFIVFFPEMWGEPIFMFHHAVLIVVSVVLPKCPGCFWTIIAFTIGEGGSASIGVDSEWYVPQQSSSSLVGAVAPTLVPSVCPFLLLFLPSILPETRPIRFSFFLPSLSAFLLFCCSCQEALLLAAYSLSH
jgi:hypothetical protein